MRTHYFVSIISVLIIAISTALSALSISDEELVRAIQHLKDPEKYSGDGFPAIGRCATPIIYHTVKNWENLDLSARARLAPLLARPSLPNTYNTPGGQFKIHYTLTGGNATDMATVYLYASKLDEVWTAQVTNMGFQQPPSDGTAGGDSRYDVYLTALPSGVYGYCETDGPATATPNPNDYKSFIVMLANLSGEANPTATAATTSAHEFHHAIQYAYTINSDDWWQENTASWAEHAVYPEYPSNEYHRVIYQNNPHISQTYTNGSFEYGGGLWPIFLWENYGTPFLVACWNNHIYSSDDIATINTTLLSYSSNFNSAFSTYSGWRYITGERNDGEHFDRAGTYPSIALAGDHSTYPVSTISPTNAPYPIACNVVRFRQNDAGAQLNIIFDGADAGQFNVHLLRSDGIRYTRQAITLGAGNTANINLTDWATLFDLALVITNIAHSGGQATYNYSASLSGAPLNPPRNLIAQSMLSGRIPLTWQAPLPTAATRTGYSVYRSNSASGPYSYIGPSTTESYNDNTVINGVVYYYRVKANYTGGESRWSNRAAGVSSSSSGGIIDTLWACGPEPYYSWFTGYNGFTLRAEFTPTTTPGRIIAMEYNIKVAGPMNALYYDLPLSYNLPIWTSAQTYANIGWNTFFIVDTIIYFNGDFACGCVFRDGTISISTTPSGTGRSYYWSGSSWTHYANNFAIRAIVQYGFPTEISETALPEGPYIFVYPNPFNSSIRIDVDLLAPSSTAHIEILDISGRRVAKMKGQRVIWTPEENISSGAYLVKIESEGNSYTKKIFLIR